MTKSCKGIVRGIGIQLVLTSVKCLIQINLPRGIILQSPLPKQAVYNTVNQPLFATILFREVL